MLPAAYRMRRSLDFDHAVRHGRRAGRRTLVVHAVSLGALADGGLHDAAGRTSDESGVDECPRAARVGFVVSRAVGPAVVRNRVKRRLRAVMAARVGGLPTGLLVVVRALPAAAEAPFEVLAGDLDAALPRAMDRPGRGSVASGRAGGGRG